MDGSSPHPSLKRQGERRGAYSVLRVDVPKWYVFLGTLLFIFCLEEGLFGIFFIGLQGFRVLEQKDSLGHLR